MSYQMIIRSHRNKESIMVKRVLQFALFSSFSLWLLSRIRQPAGASGSGHQLSNDHISNFLGRKGSAGLSKSRLNPHSGLTLEDVTNPVEEGEIPQYSKEIEAVEFYTQKGLLKEANDNNNLLCGQTMDNGDGSLTITKSNMSFPDENGFPQNVRDMFIEIESSNSVHTSGFKSQSQSRNVIVTRVGDRRNVSLEKL